MIIGALLGIGFTAPSAYLLGDFTGSQETARTERLAAALATARSERDAAKADLAAANLMAAIQSDNAEANRKAAAAAEDRANDYAEELKKRGDAARCSLNDADVGRLRSNTVARPNSPPTPPK